MKKNLLFSAALLASGLAFAGSPSYKAADSSIFKVGPNAPASIRTPQPQTRAEGSVEAYDFTYAYTPYNAISLNGINPGVTRVYMCFEMQPEDIKRFAGKEIVGFTTYSPTDQPGNINTITDARFFYSTDPKLLSPAYSQTFSMSTQAYGTNKVTLDEPYTITGEEKALFFGYSIVVPIENNMFYIVMDGSPNFPQSCMVGCSDTAAFPSLFESGGDIYGALSMSLTLVGNDFPNSFGFEYAPSSIALPLGKTAQLPVTFKSTTGFPISSFDIEYDLGGKTYNSSYNYEYPYPAGINHYLGAMLEFPAHDKPVLEDVEFKITKLNGQPYTGPDGSAKARIRVMENLPVHQTLMEEYTGTWCGYCPRGYAALEYMRTNYPDFVLASFHSGTWDTTGTNYIDDPMEVTTDFPVAFSGFPNASLNRMYTCDPYDGNATYPDLLVPIVGDIEDLNAMPTSWDIKVDHFWESDSVLVAKAEVANMTGYEDGNFEIAYLLIADGLSGNSTRWAQTNNYYRVQPIFAEELNQFCMKGIYGKSVVARLVFNDVVISADGIYGEPGSVPTSLEMDQKVEHSFSFDLTKIPVNLIPDKNKLRVVAAVLDENGNVLNCAKNEVNDFVPNGVAGVIDENAPVEYYNLNGQRVSEPSNGIFIRRQGGAAEKIVLP